MLLLLLVFLAVQKACNEKTAVPFIKATSQNWAGGAAATRGTYYKIYFLRSQMDDLQFDSLWVDEKRLPVREIKSNIPSDTLLVMANDYQGLLNPVNPINQVEMSNSVPAKFPIETEAAGLLGYFYKDKRGYFPIAQWTVLKPVAYQ